MRLRIRSTRLLILPLLALALVSGHVHPDDSGWEALLESAGLILLVAAMGGRIWASAHLTGRKNRELVTSGPFSLTRNPLYFFSLVGFVGAGLAFESVTLAALMGLVFFAAHWPTIRHEERQLEALFGEEYRRYRARVPRFIPVLRSLEGEGTLGLDTRRFRLALRDALAIPLVMVLAEVAEWAQHTGVLPVLMELP